MTATVAPELSVTGLVKHFPVTDRGHRAQLTALDGVDVTVRAGETVALVGESGSGKSTLARCIARLVEPTSGTVTLDSVRLTDLRQRSMWRAYRDLQMVFQDPLGSLNPRMTVRAIVEEPLRLHTGLRRGARQDEVRWLLAEVGLGPELLDRYPQQLSGGQRQRVGIARALAVDPRFILLDEPTAALDVSVRGHVLDLLIRLQRERNVGYLFISHDLEAVRHIADRVIVLYLGTVAEEGTAEEVFTRPRHPYTRALLSAAMTAQYGQRTRRIRLEGEIPSPIDLPAGCRLASRCPLAVPDCHRTAPELLSLSPTHRIACPVEAARVSTKEE